MSPVEGIADSIGIIVFILILGGNIGLLNATGTFDAGIAALSRKTKGREFLLIVIISSIIAVGGTTFGLATFSMPIVAPLADTVNVGRDVVVSAYNYGQGWMSFITPTGLILATLQLVNVSYSKWLKFIMPLMVIIGLLAIVMLGLQTFIHI